MIFFDLIFGLLMVFAGRDLFWLCVGVVGFLIGVQCSALLGFSNGWTQWVSALALGSMGVVLAMSFEWVTVVFGVGFLGGGYLLLNMFSSTFGQELYAWPIFVVGGIVGMCVLVITFDGALIMISSLLGATLIVNAIHMGGIWRGFLFVGCMVVGILAQYFALKGTSNQKRSARRR